MSKVEYKNRKVLRAEYIENSVHAIFTPLAGNIGSLELRNCIRERGKGQKKSITKSYQAIFTLDQIEDNSGIPTDKDRYTIGYDQQEPFQIKADFPTAFERSEWLDKSFKMREEN